MLDRGAYLGFDRFGLEMLHPDRERLAVLIGLLGLGFERQLVLSHDTVWCWRGRELKLPAETLARWKPTYVLREILPKLRHAGVAEEPSRRGAGLTEESALPGWGRQWTPPPSPSHPSSGRGRRPQAAPAGRRDRSSRATPPPSA